MKTRSNKAIFLDRDGVLNQALIRDGKPYPPAGLQEFCLIAGVKEALNALKKAGFLLICVTNQPDVARGTQNQETVEAMHQILRSILPLDDIFVCYHDNHDNCPCRKPRPGMLTEAAARHHINLNASFLIGDRWRDIAAGFNGGCRTVFIDYGYSEKRPDPEPDAIVNTLSAAKDWILTQEAAAKE